MDKPNIDVASATIAPIAIKNLFTGQRSYELTNHLGNAESPESLRFGMLSTIKDEKQQIDQNADGIVDYYEPIVITANDYYPFGMVMPNRSFSLAGSEYRFGFNKMEKDNELYGSGNAYDFGARMYDGRIGRWFSIDPLQKKYPHLSPYNFTANNPIIFIDFDGKDYDLYIDHVNKKIIVKANFKNVVEELKDNTVAANIAAEEWTKESYKYQYIVKDKKQEIRYDIVFEMNKDDNAKNNSVDIYSKEQFESIVKRANIKSSNVQDVKGFNVGDQIGVIDEYKTDKNVIKHEAGHGLGQEHSLSEHFGHNCMDETVEMLENKTIKKNIEETLGRGGIGERSKLKNEPWSGGKLNNREDVGEKPKNFEKGKVVKNN